ncbi:MAG TPA: hypothetical protein DEB39_03285 [Planctomycetaceae bacterium]|nr:hypothetical protein [Planctomycetaceae bacterium]
MSNISSPNSVDITPTPKILRTLGDIPFEIWQCFAELIDNSLDAFADAERRGIQIPTPTIHVYWSRESTPSQDREIVINDNALGMDLASLENAAKAGYSANDPISHLGLFGMGFNIATARLGGETDFVSSQKGDTKYTGIKINFEQLIKKRTFIAPVINEEKEDSNDSGTRITIRNLKDGIYGQLQKKLTQIRRQLETIYSPILTRNKVRIVLQGKQLSPRLHCVWSDSRYVIRKGEKVFARKEIDCDLGETRFDTQKNRYLSDDEIAEYEIHETPFPDHIVIRSRRLKGWIGIQRFSDTTQFGLDFIRNGRKILVNDKSLFEFENPDTGTKSIEYPIELGSTTGGRIVGELTVDYLLPTYQKNAFDTSGRAWRLTAEAIRGAGPILPKSRKAVGADGENDSPLGKLINAYRRPDAGTRTLALPNPVARDFYKRFISNDQEYLSDEKWFKAAQEADRDRGEGNQRLTPVNVGETPSDDVDSYLANVTSGDTSSAPPVQTASSRVVPPVVNSTRASLLPLSEKIESASGLYTYKSQIVGMTVTVRCMKNGHNIRHQDEKVPCVLFLDGQEVDFFYDPQHSVLSEYPISPKQLLLHGLAEKFAFRDTNAGVSFSTALWGLIDNHLDEERINHQSLQERAGSIISNIKERLPELLGHRFEAVKTTIQEAPREEEDFARRLLEEAPNLLELYQNCGNGAEQTLGYVCESIIKRLVSKFPEEFFDSKLFNLPYTTLKIGDPATRERLRKIPIDRVLSYITDIASLLQGSHSQNKHELLRYANTMSLMEGLVQ